jgi:hypothetical protein
MLYAHNLQFNQSDNYHKKVEYLFIALREQNKS